MPLPLGAVPSCVQHRCFIRLQSSEMWGGMVGGAVGSCQGHTSPLFRTGNLIPTGSSCCTDPGQSSAGAHAGGTAAATVCPLGCGVLNSGCASGNPFSVRDLGCWGSLTTEQEPHGMHFPAALQPTTNCSHKRVEKWR